MISLDTLAALQARHYALFASCEVDFNCTHFARLDTAVLIARFGADFDTVVGRDRLVGALRCTRCGRRGGAAIRLTAAEPPGIGAGWSS